MHFPRVFGSELQPISSVHVHADGVHTFSQNASIYLCGNCFLTFVAGSGIGCASEDVSSMAGASPASMLSVLLVSVQCSSKWRTQASYQVAKQNSRRLEGEWELGSSYEASLVSLGEVAFPCFVDMHLCQPSFHSSSNYWCRVWGPKAGAAHLGDVAGASVGGRRA